MGYRVIYIEKCEYLRLYLDNLKVEIKNDTLLIPVSDIQILVIDNYQSNLSMPLINKLTDNNVCTIICGVDHLPKSYILPMNGHFSSSGNISKQICWDSKRKDDLHAMIVKMKILTIKNGTNKWNLQMDHVKYIISDSSMNYTLLQAIRLFTSKDKSENRTENNISTKMFINEKEIEIKNNMFIEITEMYSLNEDKKLTTKSLMLKYLESKLQNQKYFDTISTIDILLNSLSEEVNDESTLKIMFNGANYKQLIKMLSPYYEDELQKDEFDLTRDELILFQLDLVEYISNHNSKYDNIFVFGKLDNLSDKILQKINKIENVILMIFTNYYNDLMNVQNTALLQDKIIDLADMEQIYYDLSQKSLQTYTLQEVEQMIINYLQQIYTHKTHDIYQELDHFSIK